MSSSLKGCCCIELELFSRIVAWCSILGSIFNTVGWFILGYHWIYIMVYVIMGPFCFVASVCLLQATYNKTSSYVIPWLVMSIVGVILTIINESKWLHHYQAMLTGHDVDVHVIELLVFFSVSLYLWCCIYGYYQKLSRECVQKINNHWVLQ